MAPSHVVPYPEELPRVEHAWLDWAGGATRKVLQAIRNDRTWNELPVLADILDEAGCDDPVILHHLREVKHSGCSYSGGCWQNGCWLVNLLLGDELPLMARFRWPGHTAHGDVHEGLVINPGDCDGHAWLVFLADCYDPPLYVVEARGASDAEYVFVDSDYGRTCHVDPDDDGDNADYGWQVHAGDTVFGRTFDRDCWVDLRGNVLSAGQVDWRNEPSITDGGTLFSADNIVIYGSDHARGGPLECLYFGPGLPGPGVTPVAYANRCDCLWCGRRWFPVAGAGTTDFCSPECANQHHAHWPLRQHARRLTFDPGPCPGKLEQ